MHSAYLKWEKEVKELTDIRVKTIQVKDFFLIKQYDSY